MPSRPSWLLRRQPVERPAPTGQPQQEVPLRGSLDEPADGWVLGRGLLTVRGWVAHQRREIRGVVVTGNGQVLGATHVGLCRPDVASVHPELKDAATSGWSVEVDLGHVHGDRVDLDVFVVIAPMGDAARTGLGRVHKLASRTHMLEGAGRPAAILGGCFIEQKGLTAGPQKIFGLAEAPSGVTKVEVFCDGESAGLARTCLPGRFEGANQGPASSVALFESDLRVPAGLERVTFTAVATPCEGEAFELRHWTTDVHLAKLETFRAERLAVVRERTLRAVLERRPDRSSSLGNAPPRVLVTTHDLGLGGGQLYLHELLKRLASLGVQGFVASPRGGRLVAELEDLGMPVLVTGTFDPHDAEAYEAQIGQIMPWAARHECEVALVNTMSAYPGADAAQRLGLGVVWAIHESFPFEQFWSEACPPPFPSYAAERAAGALAATRRAVFEASATLDLYAPLLPGGAGVVVPYGVDFAEIDDYRDRVDRSRLRADLGFDPDTLVLLCMGTVEPRKAQINIAQAFAGSPGMSIRDVCLVFVGAGSSNPYVEALDELVEHYDGIQIRVEPVQPDTYQWYHSADVLVCGSDVESLPRSMLEAMAFEMPIASTAVFGIPELVTDGVDGFLCASRDLLSLRTMLERVTSTPRSEIAQMGGRARRTVLERHDPAIYTRYYHDELHALAGRVRPSG